MPAGVRAAARSLRLHVPAISTCALPTCTIATSANGPSAATPPRRWDAAEEQAGRVTRVWTDPLPQAEVERVAPNEDDELEIARHVRHGGAGRARRGRWRVAGRSALPIFRSSMASGSRRSAASSPVCRARRRETAERLIADMETARQRILDGIDILSRNDIARTRIPLHESRRRHGRAAPQCRRDRRSGGAADARMAAVPARLHSAQLAGLADRTHADREIVDLLFFPTGGGKTEAYLGLAAFVIAHRRLTGPGVLGAGVAVIMRYTLRLLTLDQLARAAGVVCALELMRTDPKNVDEKGPAAARRLADRDRSVGRLGRLAEPAGRQGRRRPDHGGRTGAALQDRPATSARRRRSRPAPGAARRSRRSPSPACRTILRRPTWRSAAPTPLAISRATARCRS